MFDAFLTSSVLVALAEIGDRTQLLSFVLAARLRRPLSIIAGIFLATLANHALAASVGVALASALPPASLPWITGLLFVCFGLWALHPDALNGVPRLHRAGAFVTALMAFFVAEMGDKTQLATVTLGAHFDALATVVAGTTLGMMIANVPAVLVGEALAQRLPLRTVRFAAAAVFIATGIVTLIGAPRLAG